MKREIIEKIENSLKEPFTEFNLVYALSRIRKILENDNEKKKYLWLNFYCNLALHSRIDYAPQEITKELLENNKKDFTDFHKEIKIFFKEKNIKIKYNTKKIDKLLNRIYFDTPIAIKK